METQRVERKLSAVLAADVAGYSRLVGIDEEGTLAQLRSIRLELIDPAIAVHRGRIVKTTGHGRRLCSPGQDHREHRRNHRTERSPCGDRARAAQAPRESRRL